MDQHTGGKWLIHGTKHDDMLRKPFSRFIRPCKENCDRSGARTLKHMNSICCRNMLIYTDNFVFYSVLHWSLNTLIPFSELVNQSFRYWLGACSALGHSLSDYFALWVGPSRICKYKYSLFLCKNCLHTVDQFLAPIYQKYAYLTSA